MKKLILMVLTVCLALFTFLTCIGSEAKTTTPQSLDAIAAIVNDDIITSSELNHAIKITKIQMFQEKAVIPDKNILQKEVLKQLVNKKLQLQLAKQAGIQTSETELNQAVTRIAQQNNLSVSELYQRLNQEGMTTADYRNEMRDQITLHRLQQQEIINRIHVTPQELKSFINSNLWQDHSTQEYRLEDLLIPLPEGPSKIEIETARKKAESIIAKYDQSQSLKVLAKSSNSSGLTLQTGDLGWRKLPEIPSIFAEQVVRMKAKEIAGPIHAPNGFHILRLAEVRSISPKKMTLDRKQVENLILQRKFEENIKQWISKLRSTAFIVMNDIS